MRARRNGAPVPLDSTPLDIATLPAVVAGPVLRRVTRTQASVWLALTRSSDVTMHVRVAGQAATEVTSAAITPTRVGANLWRAVVPAAAPSGQFDAGQLYEYWLASPGWLAEP